MSDKQVREAIDLIKYHWACNAHPRESNVRTLVEAWLAEHPEDSETLVDVEWLKTCKGLESVGKYEWSATNTESGTTIRITFTTKMTVSVIDHDGNYCRIHSLGKAATRGDVRRLCRALRVELGEKR